MKSIGGKRDSGWRRPGGTEAQPVDGADYTPMGIVNDLAAQRIISLANGFS
jgi:hypothetical protein